MKTAIASILVATRRRLLLRSLLALRWAPRFNIVFNEVVKYSGPGGSERGLDMLIVSEMKQGLSRFGKDSVQ